MSTHKHRCGYVPAHVDSIFGWGRYKFTGQGCGLVFEHPDGMAGNVDAHTCASCGVRTFWQYDGRLKPGRGLRKDAKSNEQIVGHLTVGGR